MFFFVRKKVVVDCFVGFEPIANLYGFKRAIKTAPEWWKNLPSKIEQITNWGPKPTGTMKHCLGFTDLYKNAWVYSLWQDIRISVNEENFSFHTGSNGFVRPSGGMNQIDSNIPAVSNHAFSAYHSIKINSPWYLREKRGIKFAWVPAIWDSIKRYDDLHVPPAVIDFKKTYSCNTNIFVPRKNKIYDFVAGQPLVYLLPMTENKVEFRNHAVDEQEIHRLVANHPHQVFKFIKSEFKD